MEQLAFTGYDSTDDRFDQLNRWTSLMMQTFAARTYLRLLDGFGTEVDSYDMTTLLRHQGYLFNFLLCYWKCFSQSKGKRKLEASKVFARNPELLATHNRIGDLRHEAAAHNGQSGLDASSISVVEHDGHFEIAQNHASALPLHEYSSFKDALDVVEEHVAKEFEKSRASLECRLGKSIVIKKG